MTKIERGQVTKSNKILWNNSIVNTAPWSKSFEQITPRKIYRKKGIDISNTQLK